MYCVRYTFPNQKYFKFSSISFLHELWLCSFYKYINAFTTITFKIHHVFVLANKEQKPEVCHYFARGSLLVMSVFMATAM